LSLFLIAAVAEVSTNISALERRFLSIIYFASERAVLTSWASSIRALIPSILAL
jgi:hypothetical protein